MISSTTYLSMLALASAAVAQKCPLQFDGRVPAGSTPATFDTTASLFNTGYNKGQNLTWSQIIKLPTVDPASLFDAAGGTLPLEVTLSDESIFVPSPTNIQVGFRRAELMIAGNNGTDGSGVGLKTLHFSVRKDNARPLNTSHEYQLVFLEDNSFATNQFVLKTGTISGQPAGQDPDQLVLVGNVNSVPVPNLFLTKFTPDVWHNFGVVLDFNQNTTAVLYSVDSAPLANVTEATPNDLAGQGQYHFGALKKPTGEGITDPSHVGFQPSGIDEGVIYGGIFMENSAGGCISLSAEGATAVAAEGSKNGTAIEEPKSTATSGGKKSKPTGGASGRNGTSKAVKGGEDCDE